MRTPVVKSDVEETWMEVRGLLAVMRNGEQPLQLVTGSGDRATFVHRCPPGMCISLWCGVLCALFVNSDILYRALRGRQRWFGKAAKGERLGLRVGNEAI